MVKRKVAKLGLRGRGITQADVAYVVGVHRVTVARVFSGRSTSGLAGKAEEPAGLASLIWRTADLLNAIPPVALLEPKGKKKHLDRLRAQVLDERLSAEAARRPEAPVPAAALAG